MASRSSLFAERVAAEELREIDLAVAVLWFIAHQEGHAREVSLTEILEFFADHRLRANVNASRLSKHLKSEARVMRGKLLNHFKIRAGAEKQLVAHYVDAVEPSLANVNDLLIPNSISLGNRRHLDHLRREANGAFEYGLYNGSAVMCRRLVELLLIEAFCAEEKASAIQDGKGDFVVFSEMIDKARSGQFIKLSRAGPKSLDRIKAVGDAAAHHRYHLTTRQDLELLNPSMAQLISELAGIARL